MRRLLQHQVRTIRPGEPSQLTDWLAWADLEIDNIRAVLDWCKSRGDAERGTGLAASLGWYWITCTTSEGIRWLDEFLSATGPDAAVYGWACFVRGFLSVLRNDPRSAQRWLRTAIATARSTGQRELLTEALAMASIAADSAGIAPALRHSSTRHERPQIPSITRLECSRYCKLRHCMDSPKATRAPREPQLHKARTWPGRQTICTGSR